MPQAVGLVIAFVLRSWSVLAVPLQAAFTLGAIVVGVGIVVLDLTTPKYEPSESSLVTCPANRVIVRVFGTHSAGDFEPGYSLNISDLNPPRPPLDVASAVRNTSFNTLLNPIHDCPTITFSYDDRYLPDNAPVRGVDAWNDSASPWNGDPKHLEMAFDQLLRSVRRANDHATFDVVAYSAGGIVPAYWAARGLDEERIGWIHSIIAVDAVVGGFDAFDVASCEGQLRPIRIFPWLQFGRFPCQFASDSEFMKAVASGTWTDRIPIATIRAQGDLIVWYDAAGLRPGAAGPRTISDVPGIHVPSCDWTEIRTSGLRCLSPTRSHGYVLVNGRAIDELTRIVLAPRARP